MQWPVKEGISRRELDDLPEIHHRDPVRDVAHDREVVGDEQRGQPELGLEVLHQVDDLRLDGDVECRDGFVGDQQIRLERERASDPDSLSLSAGEGVRKPAP